MKVKVYFIDPMSYNNLELYDKSLISNKSEKFEILFFCNKRFTGEDLAGVSLNKVFNYSNMPKHLKPLSYILSLIKILFFSISSKPNIVHIQWFKLPVFDYYFYYLLKIFNPKTKLIHTAHNVLPHTPRKNDKKNYIKLYNLVDSIIVHTENSQEELNILLKTKDSENKVVVIPHGLLSYPIDETLVNEKIKSLDFLHLKNGKIVFSCLGYQNHYKGIDIVVDLWLNSPKFRNNNKIILLIAGKGYIPRLNEIQQLENTYIINNFLDDITFLSYLKLSDVILLPYRKISQSGLLLTAMNYKKPVIASNIGGLKDPFKFGKIGWLIESYNSMELNDVINSIIEEPQILTKIKTDANLWNLIEKHYSWTEIQDKTFKLYAEVLNNKR